ncbi:heat stress transcription factor C-1-like [Brassica napus]|uniref:heat stress transcription factor C-1-like n=1 Tax=Brassica napus TaxID=3708 RepID=UPI0006AAF5B0|nr:heat stress transcription factor C-1-like [Brassica napus]
MAFTREEAFDRVQLRDLKHRVFDFVKKAYVIVNDPSTDSMILWGPNGNSLIVQRPLPLEYTEFFLFHSGALSMERFVTYGFTMTVSGSQVEYANDDFVRGQPERLEKICEPFVARLKQDNELRLKLNNGEHPILEFDAGWVLIHVVDDPATNSFISWGSNVAQRINGNSAQI